MDKFSNDTLKFLKQHSMMPIENYDNPERISTGSIMFDYVLGGGIPRSRLTVITGDPSTGKTTVALLMAASVAANAETMKNGGRAAFMDFERSYDPTWADRLGVDSGSIDLFQPETLETGLEGITHFLTDRSYDLIVLDSVAAAPTKAEVEGGIDDNYVGVAAKKYHQWFRSNRGLLESSGTALVFINQITLKIGVMYGNPETTYGGRAIPFAAAIIVKMLSPNDKDGGDITLRFKTSKNKTARRDREGEIIFRMVEGVPYVDVTPELVKIGKELRIFLREDGSEISGNCSWFFLGEKVAAGEPNVVRALDSDADLRGRVEDAVYQAIANLNRKPVERVITEEGETEDDTPFAHEGEI